MYMHIRLRPVGNGFVLIGTPDELKAQFAVVCRNWYKSEAVPFEAAHSVEVRETGSRYYIQSSEWGEYYIMERGKFCDTFTPYSYESFALAVNRLCKLLAADAD